MNTNAGKSDPSTQVGENLPRLVEVMQRLLAPDGCPWDREQTFETLRAYTIEEAFEVVDAINSGSPTELCEELGDLLLQIVFQAELARTKGWFTPNDVVDAICEKLIRRHPHVFSDTKVSDSDEVVRNWEAIKKKEKGDKGKPKSALSGVPGALPALLRAVRVGEKAASVGYDWPDAGGPREKVNEELRELDQALASGDKAHAEEELGDVLFSMASFARKNGLDPESALRSALDKFTKRFESAEAAATEGGKALSDMNAAELDGLWEKAKQTVG